MSSWVWKNKNDLEEHKSLQTKEKLTYLKEDDAVREKRRNTPKTEVLGSNLEL
jgi:hypothetical protein